MDMGMQRFSAVCWLAGSVWMGCGCTVARVETEEGPARLESNGLIDGHAAVGFRADDSLFDLELLDGTSDGALAELSLWKLFRLEVGLLGLGVGIGPLDVGLGFGFYEPEVPEFEGHEPAPSAEVESCALCEPAGGR